MDDNISKVLTVVENGFEGTSTSNQGHMKEASFQNKISEIHHNQLPLLRLRTQADTSLLISAFATLTLIYTLYAERYCCSCFSLQNIGNEVVSTGKDAAHPKFPEGSSCRV